MIKTQTAKKVFGIMMEDVEALTNENYHTEASIIEDQATALLKAAASGYVLGYFSWSAGDIGGLREFIVVLR